MRAPDSEKKEKRKKKIIIRLTIILLILFVASPFYPTWTRDKGGNGIFELTKVNVGDTKLDMLIRGDDIDNPVLLFVHGGPANSEIPYASRFDAELEKDFIVVHYDQRAAGKSYHFFDDYKNLSIDLHKDDLLKITDYLRERFKKDKVILVGHSFGTYIGLLAVSEAPDKYEAYVGIGQVADVKKSERDAFEYCCKKALEEGNTKDYEKLCEIKDEVYEGKMLTPRKYLRKYGGDALKINEVGVLVKGMILGSEYNLYDCVTYVVGALFSQRKLLKEASSYPVIGRVTNLDVPFYFVMGENDYMTSADAAKVYFETIDCDKRHEFAVFEGCAHFPHLEEPAKFAEWLREKIR